MVLPLRSAGFSMPESSRTTSCMKPLPPNTATILMGTPLPRTITGTDLLCNVDAAATDRVTHVKPGFGKIALALGELDRSERRQYRRGRKQICDALGGLYRTARDHRENDSKGKQLHAPLDNTVGHQPRHGIHPLGTSHLDAMLSCRVIERKDLILRF